jgi:predicted HTH transcriptional regulator
LAEPLYLTKYIERMGTGTGDMITRCRNAGLPEPEFTLTDGFVITLRRKPGRAFEAVGGEVTGEVERLVLVLQREMKRTETTEGGHSCPPREVGTIPTEIGTIAADWRIAHRRARADCEERFQYFPQPLYSHG